MSAAKLTNAQLAAQLEAAHVSYQALEAKHQADLALLRHANSVKHGLQEQVNQLSTEVGKLRQAAKLLSAPRQVVASHAHDNYVKALLAAKDMAMRTGRSVRVG